MENTGTDWRGYAALILGLIGLCVAGYLASKQLAGTELGPCPIFAGGCEDVLHSDYSNLFGIPLSFYGAVFYGLVIIMSGLWVFAKKNYGMVTVAFLGLVGFIASAVFIYIQGSLIGSYCFYCVTSAVTSTLLFFVMLPRLIDTAFLSVGPTQKPPQLPNMEA